MVQLQVYKRKERPVQRFQLSAIWLPPQLGLIVVILERPVQRFRFVLERGMRARGCDCKKKKKERSGRYTVEERTEAENIGERRMEERERERERGREEPRRNEGPNVAKPSISVTIYTHTGGLYKK